VGAVSTSDARFLPRGHRRSAATAFRDFLLDDGFQMMQLSVYMRPCVSFARQETHMDRTKKSIPPEGKVRAFFVTRAQWERAFVIYGSPAKEVCPEQMPEQIQLW